MPIAWDTTLVSRLRPGSPALTLFERRLRSPDRVVLPSTTIAEAVFGYARAAPGQLGSTPDLRWLLRFVLRPEVGVLEPSRVAAFATGLLRARSPFPPPRRRGDRRAKPERRVAWVADIHIAASAWAVGVPLETENVRDFTLLSELLLDLIPGALPLEVRPSPLEG